jgi:hypothetical protein
MSGGSLVTTAWRVLKIAGGGEGLQKWRTAAIILNKQSRTANKGWSSSLGVGRGACNTSPYKCSMLRNVIKRLGPALIRQDLSNGKRTRDF